MNKLKRRLGNTAFWLLWPALFVYFRLGARTRILLVCEGKVLVVCGWLGNGKWGLPGGGLRRSEQPLSGVLRELQEETGIKLRPTQVRPFLTNVYKDKGFRFVCHYFEAELAKKPAAKAQHEISAAAWKPPAELTKTTANVDVLTALAAWSNR